MRCHVIVLAMFSGALVLSACGSPSSSTNVRTGPQAVSPVSPGPNNRGAKSQHTAAPSSNAIITCPQGGTLIRTPSGLTSCAHTSASNLTVGDSSVFDPARVEAMRAEATATGQPVAYSDGVSTVTISPTTGP